MTNFTPTEATHHEWRPESSGMTLPYYAQKCKIADNVFTFPNNAV